MRNLACFVAVILALAGACSGGGGESTVDPSVDEFDVSTSVQDEIDDAATNGGGAEGSYEYDEDTGSLTINISTSSFACGVETGALEATVVSVSDTTLVLRFGTDEDDGEVVWTRQDMGVAEPVSALVGIWKTTEPELFLVLSNDGSAQLFGADELCGENDDMRERNGENCLSMDIDGGSNIDIDGEFADWNAIGSSATLSDEEGDYQGSDDGADLSMLQVAWSFDKLYVRMDVHAVPSEAFQSSQSPNSGLYRLTVRGDGGLSIGSRVAYSPESQSWGDIDQNAGIEVGVGHAGIEWSIDLNSYLGEGFETIDLIMVEPVDCGSGNCETLDDMDCAWINVPQ